jgi:hypothetical protein
MSFVYDKPGIDYKTQVFYSSTNWIIPQGVTTISITAIGAGGGGGGGTTAAVTAARSGGGGGGSGGITRLTIPTMFLTDSLVINIGTGGDGGVSSGGTGANGGNTFVDMVTKGNGDIYTRVIIASGGTGSVGSANGTGANIAVIGDALYSSMGVWVANGGVSGVVGNTADGAATIFGSTGIPLTGGAGGGGMAANITAPTGGGTVTGVSTFIPSNPGGTSGGRGNLGNYSITPFYSLGGSGGGGGGTTPTSGGNGGDGAPGCGGGGGGGGTTPTGVGGTGGKGGNGIVIITCW